MHFTYCRARFLFLPLLRGTRAIKGKSLNSSNCCYSTLNDFSSDAKFSSLTTLSTFPGSTIHRQLKVCRILENTKACLFRRKNSNKVAVFNYPVADDRIYWQSNSVWFCSGLRRSTGSTGIRSSVQLLLRAPYHTTPNSSQ